ncbi:MAG: RusA family crossover junction endodeoxyribonuclease [Anaerolineae bacterium]|nr:RusA family crossover junction endodeoxyribonuclease [Anaerolineae bacterium]MCB0253260.1 RusA family crossover junction endodeoxyribonuclease [Anaerolineae bacterium]
MSTQRVTLRLPLPPSINQQYATVNGRRVLSRTSRSYKKKVIRQIKNWRDRGLISDEFVQAAQSGYLALFIDFYFETPLRRDLDGGLKIAQDAICAGLGMDDRRVVDIHLIKRTDRARPRIEVELEAIANWTFAPD